MAGPDQDFDPTKPFKEVSIGTNKPPIVVPAAPVPNARPVPQDDISKEAWFPIYDQLRKSPEVAKSADLPKDPGSREYALRSAAQQVYHKLNPGSQFAQDYKDAPVLREGWGLSQETKKGLGVEYDANGNMTANPIRNALGNVADLAFRGYQGALAGGEAAATGLDRTIDETGINDLLAKYLPGKFAPGGALMALMEALPDGGLHMRVPGFVAPKGDTLPPEVRTQLNTEATELFNRGASKEQMDAWAQDRGLPKYGNEMVDAIVKRDAARPKKPANENAPQAGNTDLAHLVDNVDLDKLAGTEPKDYPTDPWTMREANNNLTTDMNLPPENIFAEASEEFNQPPAAANDEALSGIDKDRLPAVTENFTGEGVAYPGGTEVTSRGTRKAAGASEKFAQEPFYSADNENVKTSAGKLNVTGSKYNAEVDGTTHFLDFESPTGKRIEATLDISDADPTSAILDIPNAEKNGFGPAQIRDAALKLQVEFPDLKTIEGLRTTGARKGKNLTQTVDISKLYPKTAEEISIKSPEEYAQRASEEGLPFINSPEAIDYYTKNAPAIKAELDARATPDSDILAAVRKEQGRTQPKNDNVPETPEETARLDLEHAETVALDNPQDAQAQTNLQEARGNFETVTGKSATEVSGSGSGPGGPKGPVEPPEEPSKPVHERLTEALNKAGKATAEQKRLYAEAKGDRVRAARNLQRVTSGEEGLHAELGALKGELPKAEFEAVRDQFSQDDIKSLFNQVRDHPKMSLFDGIRGRIGLKKLLDGKVPTPSELEILKKVFPPEFIQAAIKHRSLSEKLMTAGANAINLPRALMSSFDLSAPLRQGLFFINRGEFWKALPDMFKQFAKGFGKDDHAFEAFMDEIRERPTYDLMQEGGLSLGELGKSLTDREEAFTSQWAERIPVVGRGVKASERAYTAFLNKVRADVFDTLVGKFEEAGRDLSKDPKALKDLTGFINAATGRGSLGKLSSAGPMLNGLFFSPRLIASRITLLRPDYYVKLDPIVRKEAIKSAISLGTIALVVTQLARMGGATVEADPRSSDFAKIKNGNTRYDILGGFGQYIVLGSRLATNENKSLKGNTTEMGKAFGSRNRLDAVEAFGESKFSPVASFVADYLRGKNMAGEDFDLKKETVQRFIPLFLQDAADVMKEKGPIGAVEATPGIFGVGVQTFDDKSSFNKKLPFTTEDAPKPKGLIDSIIPKAGASTPEAPPAFDPSQPFEEQAPPFNPDLPFKESTSANENAVGILEGLGLKINDSGIRSRAKQEELFRKYKGVARPGTGEHEIGDAIDIGVPPSDISVDDIVSAMEDAGYSGVRIITKKHGSGPHWHVQWDSFKE